MAAGAALVLEAGGRLTDYVGAPGDPRNGQLVATNGMIHAELVGTIQNARRAANVSV
jgi:myo-inositol-1(or 4)-monophosphatase